MKLNIIIICTILVVSSYSTRLVSGLATADSSKNNKFRQRLPTDDALPAPNLYALFLLSFAQSHFSCFIFLFQFAYRDEDELLNKQCPQNLELRWQTEVSSSIYATPLIADINRSRNFFVVVTAWIVFMICYDTVLFSLYMLVMESLRS